MATSDPLVWKVYVYHTEMHHRVLARRPLDPEFDLFLLYTEIIKMLNERMQTAETACTDENILSVSGLQIFGGIENTSASRTRWPTQGPLMNLNGVALYGQLKAVAEHRIGQDAMIKQRGGLQNIKTPGIAAMISL